MHILISTIGLFSFLGAVALSINETHDSPTATVWTKSDSMEQDTTRHKSKRKDKHKDPFKGDTTYNNRQTMPIDTMDNNRKWDTMGNYPDSLRR